MRSTNLLTSNDSSLIGAWAKLAHALAFPAPLGEAPVPKAKSAGRLGIFARLDRWFWNQEMKQREAWLAQSQDIFELERRMRVLERLGSRYY
jgi:hypothetical protein